MADYNMEDRVAALEAKLSEFSEEMDFFDQEIKERNPEYYEDSLECWGELKKKYDNAYYELQEIKCKNQ